MIAATYSRVVGKAKGNPCHVKSGPTGGQFCATRGGGASSEKPINFIAGNPSTMDNFLRRASESWKKKLEGDHVQSIRKYTKDGNYNKRLNADLRSGKPVGTREDTVKALDAAIAKHSFNKDIGVSAPLASKLTPGVVFKDKGYTSTSLDFSIADDFSGFDRGAKGLVMRIRVPAGRKAAPINGLSSIPDENEVLLPRGSSYKVIGNATGRYQGRTVSFLDVEVVGATK